MKSNPRPSCRIGQITCAAVIAIVNFTSAATAQSTAADVYKSGAERIDAAATIRALSQQTATAVCLMDQGIDPDRNRRIISQSIAEYDQLINAMTEGDASLGIALPETGRRMQEAIRGLSLQWDNYKLALAQRIAGEALPENGPDYVARHNLNAMHSAKYVASEVINNYAIPPALLQGDAFTLNIATRQRSLALQIAKEACGVITGNSTMGNQNRLNGAIRRFEASHRALLTGFEAAGVSPPPTDAIAEGLADITSDWEPISTKLGTIAPNTDATVAQDLFQGLTEVGDAYDALVDLYVEDSKAGI